MSLSGEVRSWNWECFHRMKKNEIKTGRNKPPEVRKHFEQFVPGDIAISSITVAELQYGVEKSAAREKNALALEAFLLPLEIASFDTESALAYGKIRADLEIQGTPIGSMDMLIAAQAIAQGFTAQPERV